MPRIAPGHRRRRPSWMTTCRHCRRPEALGAEVATPALGRCRFRLARGGSGPAAIDLGLHPASGRIPRLDRSRLGADAPAQPAGDAALEHRQALPRRTGTRRRGHGARVLRRTGDDAESALGNFLARHGDSADSSSSPASARVRATRSAMAAARLPPPTRTCGGCSPRAAAPCCSPTSTASTAWARPHWYSSTAATATPSAGPLLHRGEGPTRALFAAEHITPREPDAAERELAERTLAAVPFAAPLLYARVDLLRTTDGARACSNWNSRALAVLRPRHAGRRALRRGRAGTRRPEAPRQPPRLRAFCAGSGISATPHSPEVPCSAPSCWPSA